MPQPPAFLICYPGLAPDILHLADHDTVSVPHPRLPYRAALTAHNKLRAGSLRISPAPTIVLFKLRCLRLAPGSAPTPRQTPCSAAAAATAPSAPASASASSASAASASASADPATTSAATASAAAAPASTAGELQHRPRLLDTFLVEKVERRQGDVGNLLLTQSEGLKRGRSRRRHTCYRFAGCCRRCSQGQSCKA